MLHLGSIGGTSIDVDFTFFILIFLFAMRDYDRGLAYALVWAPVIFISILFHEFAHAGSIAMFGFGSSHIVLGGMGGVTINERHARPWQDMIISAAGPLSSFALAWICRLVLVTVPFAQQDPMLRVFLPLMYWAGIVWGFFNLLPIPPLDGGKAFRNLLRTMLRENLAFTIAVWVAMVVGAGIVIWSLARRDYFLALIIGWFTFSNFQQWQEYRQRGFPGD
jgi:Zn-dependent protease